MRIKITPLDTLFFKDGKPFSMGDESWADGLFPPPPSVFYGAIRTAYFSEHPGEFHYAGSKEDPTNKLIINGIYFYIDDYLCYPLPFDYVKKKNDKEDKKVYAMKIKKIDFPSKSPLTHILQYEQNNNSHIEKIESVYDGLIRESMFKKYLEGRANEFTPRYLTEFVTSEPKVGIGRSNLTHSTSESQLYRVGMRRLESKKEFERNTEKISFVVDFTGLSLSSNGNFKLGAEGKIVKYNMIEVEPININFEELIDKSKILKIVLLTPSLFKNGWYPDIENNRLLKNLKLKLLTAAIGKPINIGGFDMKDKRPKVMRKAVPAGSVYYCTFDVNQKSEIINLIGKSISDYQQNEGFGICIIGGVK